MMPLQKLGITLNKRLHHFNPKNEDLPLLDYPDPRLSGLFYVVLTSPDNQGSS